MSKTRLMLILLLSPRNFNIGYQVTSPGLEKITSYGFISHAESLPQKPKNYLLSIVSYSSRQMYLPNHLLVSPYQRRAQYSPNNPDDEKTSEEQEWNLITKRDESKSFMFTILIILLLVFSLFMIKRRIRQKDILLQGRWIFGSTKARTNYLPNSYPHQEVAQLSNEDEWAWEDKSRKDVEMRGAFSDGGLEYTVEIQCGA